MSDTYALHRGNAPMLVSRPHEVFAVVFLDAQNRLLVLEELFRGSLTQTSDYPRDVVKRALDLQYSRDQSLLLDLQLLIQTLLAVLGHMLPSTAARKP